MNKTGAFQATFAGGMIEGIKQDQPFERNDGSLSSVLWLENYNHTLQEDSAIKRWGEVDSGVPLLDLGYFCPNEVYSGVVNGGNDYEVNRAALLQGVQMYSVVHPQYNDNITTFLKRYDFIPQWIIDEGTLESGEAVAVVNYTIAKDGDSPAWQEVWADGNLDYPGWYTFGSLADVTRYGETLLFTTTLDDLPYFQTDGTKNPVNDYLYPVYRYLYWDIRKKWKNENQFMNGVGIFADAELSNPANAAKFAKWKVLPPSQSIVNGANIGIIKGYVSATESLLHDGTVAPKYDVSIAIQECVGIAWRLYYNGTHYVVDNRYTPSWMRSSAFYNSGGGWTGDEIFLPSSEVQTLERLDIKGFDETFYGKSINGAFDIPSLYNPVNSTTVTVTLLNDVPVTSGTNHYTPDMAIGEIAAFPGYRYGIGNNLVRYTDGTPRFWLPGEKINVVLTANIGGIEVLLFTGEYTTQYPIVTHYTTLGVEYLYVPPFYPKHDTYAGQYTITVFDSGSAEEKTLEGVGVAYSQFTKLPGTTDKYAYASLMYFTIGVSTEFMEKLIDVGCTSLSLWASKPNSNDHTLRSIGIAFDSPSGNSYTKPENFSTDVPDYTKMALLKKFVIDGRTERPDTYSDWTARPLATNAWNIRTDPTGFQEYIAVPLPALDETMLIATPILPNDNYVEAYLDDPVANNYWGAGAPYWTPDFIVWDYPTETTLFLNSSGKYWKGLGAKLITVIKGRTFIGGCIGADGIEEQAILRYSDVQGGAISPDVFSEERKIQVGHMPHTALLEFREQLWAFSRYQFYRIGMASITQEETWEFFDVVEQGCFNVKSAIVVPYGVCFCNEAGVWLSEGGEPQNLALPILPTYQHISSGTQYLYTTINQLDGVPYIDEKGINPYMELNYDSFNDEILISSPLFTVVQNDDNNTDYLPNTDFTMIFSFKYKTWRIESSVVPPYELEIQ